MAAAVAKKMFAEAGLADLEVVSAGVMACDGAAASSGAVGAAARVGLDLSRHSSSVLTPELMCRSALVLAMTQAHKDAVCRRFAEFCPKVFLLSEYAGGGGDVADPFGQHDDVYEKCRDSMAEYIGLVVKKIIGGIV